MLTINNVPVEDTFAEAFPMTAARLIVTAATPQWAMVAGQKATGYASSVIGCDVEAGIERILSPEETPDGAVLAEHNCPIYDVAQRFPRACQCEHELFERVLHVTITREDSLVDGGQSCRYRIVDAHR